MSEREEYFSSKKAVLSYAWLPIVFCNVVVVGIILVFTSIGESFKWNLFSILPIAIIASTILGLFFTYESLACEKDEFCRLKKIHETWKTKDAKVLLEKPNHVELWEKVNDEKMVMFAKIPKKWFNIMGDENTN